MVSASGQVLFQRFYFKRTLCQYHPFFGMFFSLLLESIMLVNSCHEQFVLGDQVRRGERPYCANYSLFLSDFLTETTYGLEISR